MHVSEGVDEIARTQVANLGHHHRQERIGGDIEGHTQEKIGATLIQLATELAFIYMKLEEHMTRGECHPIDLGGIPRVHDEPARLWIGSDLGDDTCDLVDPFIFRATPVPPLCAIDTPEISLLVRPFIPNRHPMLVQPADVSVAAQEPKQLVNNRFQMELFRRQKGKALAQIKSGLSAENRERADSGTIGATFSLF